MRDMKCKARLAKLFPAFGIVALLGACHIDPESQTPAEMFTSHTVDHGNWQQIPARVENQVEPITFVHATNFDPGETELSEAEMKSLLAFLQSSGVHEGARIEIDGPRGGGGYFDPVTAARVAEIEAELSDIGLRSEIPVRPMTTLLRPDDAIAVSVTRAVVVLPDCSAPQPEAATRPEYNFNCSNTAALGMMVADPLDLKRGRNEGAADGEAAAKVIQLYRQRQPSGYPNQ
ncbi:MAG: CpaD family pilus assembly lipoprotein [Alphaproteobacteria bacterium]